MPKDRSYKPVSRLVGNNAAFSALPENAVGTSQINDVIVISTGPAKGHFAVKESSGKIRNYNPENPEHKGKALLQIMIDTTMLDQVVKCASSRPTVKAKMNHGDDAGTHFGFYNQFRRDGEHVRACLHLHDDLEMAKVVRNIAMHTPTEYGNSIDYGYRYEADPSGKFALARCEKLSSVDLVDAPAATNALLEELEIEDPQHNTDMPLTQEEKNELVSALGAVVDAKLGTLKTDSDARMAALEKTVSDATAKLAANPGLTKEDVEAAQLKAITSVLPKAKLEALNIQHKTIEDRDTFEAKVTEKLATMENPDRGRAIKLCAQEFPSLYRARMSKVG